MGLGDLAQHLSLYRLPSLSHKKKPAYIIYYFISNCSHAIADLFIYFKVLLWAHKCSKMSRPKSLSNATMSEYPPLLLDKINRIRFHWFQNRPISVRRSVGSIAGFISCRVFLRCCHTVTLHKPCNIFIIFTTEKSSDVFRFLPQSLFVSSRLGDSRCVFHVKQASQGPLCGLLLCRYGTVSLGRLSLTLPLVKAATFFFRAIRY